jgi:hypothetical protein
MRSRSYINIIRSDIIIIINESMRALAIIQLLLITHLGRMSNIAVWWVRHKPYYELVPDTG